MTAVIAATLGPDSSAVDVGASRGAFLARMVRCAPNGRHTAVEARADAAADLRQRFPSVTVHEAAASDASGSATFTHVTNLPELSGFRPRTWPHESIETEHIIVPTLRLDDVLDGPVALIKIDVESAEAACLRGAQRVLGDYQPVILIEHGATVAGDPGDPDHVEIYELLTGAGLRVYDIDANGPLSLREFASASASGRMWNFLARP